MAIRWTDATPALRLARLPGHPSRASTSNGLEAALPGTSGESTSAESTSAESTSGTRASGTRASGNTAVDIWIAPEVDRDVMAHLLTQDVEQGGLLVGQAYAGDDADAVAHVRITGSAPAEDADGTAFSLRMGTGVWQAAQALLGPGEMIVGWYHSHPGLTAFFSDTDRQTQRAFFNHPYSVGWVIDPLNRDEALFLGGDCVVVKRGPDRLQPPGND